MRFQSGLVRACSIMFAIALAAGCGGSGGGTHSGKSSLSFGVDDQAPVDSSEQGVGIGPAGDTVVQAATADASVQIILPAVTPGTYSSDAAAGARLVYTDPAGAVFEASDGLAGSSYTITVERYDADRVSGTFRATVVGSDGATHTLEGSFDVAFATLAPADPYGGTYMGIFRLQGQSFEGYDPNPPNDPIWGPLQTFSFRVTVRLQLMAAASGSYTYNASHVVITDPFFGCQLEGCAPVLLATVTLPKPPGTPVPSGQSKAGQGIVLDLPSGAELYTWPLAEDGALYTSTDARVMSNSLSVTQGWEGSNGSDPYSTFKLGSGPNPDTFRQTWALTKSAL